ncbi:MAG TPA: MBL fold metallo-hydrolase, partial [Polyangiaceae bacterium]
MPRPSLLAFSVLLLMAGCGSHRAATSPPATVAPPAAALPTAGTSPLFASEPVKLADGVYGFIAPEPRADLVTGNSVLVIGDDGALVVDTGHFPSLARAQIAAIRRLTDQPVRYVVTTHWHPDHLFGNEAYRQAFPGVVFLGHAETRRLALLRDPAYIDQQHRFGDLLLKLRTMQRSGMADGKALDDDDRRVLGP